MMKSLKQTTEIKKDQKSGTLLRNISESSLANWVLGDTPNLAELNRTRSVELKVTVIGELVKMIDRHSASQYMDESTVNDLANELIIEFPHWKMQDVQLFCKTAARKKTFHGVDYAQIWEWITEYEQTRSEELIKQNRNKRPTEEKFERVDKDTEKSKKIAGDLLKSFSGVNIDEDGLRKFRIQRFKDEQQGENHEQRIKESIKKGREIYRAGHQVQGDKEQDKRTNETKQTSEE